MLPSEIAATLARDPRLIIPVGACEQHGPHLPPGCDTIIAEHLADDLSAEFGVLRAPTVEYGVNVETERGLPANAWMRRKTLHRMLNDLLQSWERRRASDAPAPRAARALGRSHRRVEADVDGGLRG